MLLYKAQHFYALQQIDFKSQAFEIVVIMLFIKTKRNRNHFLFTQQILIT